MLLMFIFCVFGIGNAALMFSRYSASNIGLSRNSSALRIDLLSYRKQNYSTLMLCGLCVHHST